MDKRKELIYLAALLHDIGKFYQRADNGSVKKSEFLSEYCKDESSFCPCYNGNYTHKHVLWTAQFIDKYSSVFKTLTNSDSRQLDNQDSLINLAAKHHLKKEQLSELGQLIKEADCLSSGMDRESNESYKDEQAENNWNQFKMTRMVSIMQTINTPIEGLDFQHLPVKPITLSKDNFPQKTFDSAPDYKGLWHQFEHDFKFIQANTYHAFSETLLNLLYKYTTYIPSSTIHFPDVSLYDHLKTTAALAVCLYENKQHKGNTEEPFLLIGADFSGIQPYIYQIISKYAGKNLKGRSFYLRLLSDTIVRFLLKRLELFQANIIYNSGGCFYIIAPNTDKTRQNLQKAIEDIEKQLFTTHKTALFVAVDYVEMSKAALMHTNGENLRKVWGELFNKRDKKKNNKFSLLLENNYSTFFEPSSNILRDSITGEEFEKDEPVVQIDDLRIKQLTNQQIELGKSLRESEIMVVADGNISYWNDKTHISPANLGFTYYFLNKKDLEQAKEQLRASADKVSVITLNGTNGDCDFMGKVDGINNIYGLEFYGGNIFNNRTFEEMCDPQKSKETFSRLGVLRMDVDNLGEIFQNGIAANRATLSRYAALSRSFDYFFSGYLNTIWRETSPERSFIIYSGGDDLFIVGSWDCIIELAHKIQTDFKAFCCSNPQFSISGGIAIVAPKYPIMKAAEESEMEERNAKGHTCNQQSKNSISFMDFPLNWENEFPAVLSLKNKLVSLINSEQLPKSFISKILSHAANAGIVEHTITRYKTFWMLTYDLSRMSQRIKAIEAKQAIDQCKIEICTNHQSLLSQEKIATNYHALELWAFACRWAELEIRSNKQ